MKRLCKIVFLAAVLINPAFIYADQIKPLLDVAGDRQEAEKASQAKIGNVISVNKFHT